MSVISTPVDFVGLNVYLPGSYVSARDDAPGFVAVPLPAKFPTMNSTWLKIGPEALYWGPRNVAKVMERERHLHHRERLLGDRCARRGRT